MPVVQVPYCSQRMTVLSSSVAGTELLRYLTGEVILDLSALLLSSLPHVLVSLTGADAASRTEIQASK